ncbi:MAG: hypothetical protein R3F46_05685 [bacterium]
MLRGDSEGFRSFHTIVGKLREQGSDLSSLAADVENLDGMQLAGNPNLRVLLAGYVALAAGNMDWAIGYMRPLADLVDQPQAMLIRGQVLLRAGRTEEAAEALESLLLMNAGEEAALLLNELAGSGSSHPAIVCGHCLALLGDSGHGMPEMLAVLCEAIAAVRAFGRPRLGQLLTNRINEYIGPAVDSEFGRLAGFALASHSNFAARGAGAAAAALRSRPELASLLLHMFELLRLAPSGIDSSLLLELAAALRRQADTGQALRVLGWLLADGRASAALRSELEIIASGTPDPAPRLMLARLEWRENQHGACALRVRELQVPNAAAAQQVLDELAGILDADPENDNLAAQLPLMPLLPLAARPADWIRLLELLAGAGTRLEPAILLNISGSLSSSAVAEELLPVLLQARLMLSRLFMLAGHAGRSLAELDLARRASAAEPLLLSESLAFQLASLQPAEPALPVATASETAAADGAPEASAILQLLERLESLGLTGCLAGLEHCIMQQLGNVRESLQAQADTWLSRLHEQDFAGSLAAMQPLLTGSYREIDWNLLLLGTEEELRDFRSAADALHSRTEAELPAELPETETAAVPPRSSLPPERNVKDALIRLTEIPSFSAAFVVDANGQSIIGEIGDVSDALVERVFAYLQSLRARQALMEHSPFREVNEDTVFTLDDSYNVVRSIQGRDQSLTLYLVLDREDANLALTRVKLSQAQALLQA